MFKTSIVDNGLPERFANQLEKCLLTEFPWVVVDNKYFTPTKQNAVVSNGFACTLCCPDGNPTSPFFNLFCSVPYLVADKLGYTGPIKISQIRPYMQVPDGKPNELNTVHLDFDYPHLVLLQYVSESNGDTYFFTEDEKTIIDRVEYKANRFVLFDGRLPHTGSSPVNSKRVVISYTLKLENYDKL